MTFVDTNVFMYAVGRRHPLRDPARESFKASARDHTPLCTSAEVVQEMLYAYVPVGRLQTLDAALALLAGSDRESMCGLWSTRTSRLPANSATRTPAWERGTCAIWRAVADAA